MADATVRIETASSTDVHETFYRDEIRLIVTLDDPYAECDAEQVKKDIKDWLDKGGDPPVILLTGVRVQVFGVRERSRAVSPGPPNPPKPLHPREVG